MFGLCSLISLQNEGRRTNPYPWTGHLCLWSDFHLSSKVCYSLVNGYRLGLFYDNVWPIIDFD